MSQKAKAISLSVALFVAAGIAVGFVFVKGKGDPRGENGALAKPDDGIGPINSPAAPSSVAIKSPRPETVELPKAGSSRVVAYYFHRTVRCHTCLAIEDLSRQTIENLFGEELAEGRVEWRPVNIEEKGNEHFENDYKLNTQSLVFVKITDGKQADWKNLTSVWDLIDNQEKFIRYVQDELTKYLRS